jgi:hypothetical protein
MADLLDLEKYENIEFTLKDGSIVVFPVEEIKDAILTKQRDFVVLIIPDKGRSDWVFDIIKIEGK